MTLPEPREFSVTLVHGTFAKGAAWMTEGSLLRQTLSDELKGKVNFSQFQWSGHNSQSERLKAGNELRGHLTEKVTQQPAAAHFIIAHSHGGNVALVALSGIEDTARFAGLVCLATPFLRFRSRRVSLMLLLVVLGILAPFFLLLTSRLNQDHHRPFASCAELIGVLAAFVSASAGLYRKLRRLVCARQGSAALLYPVPGQGRWPLFAISLLYDEARLLLRGLWRVAELPFLLWNRYICLLWVAVCLLLFIAVGNEGTIPRISRDGLLYFSWFLLTASFVGLCIAGLPLLLGQLIMFLSVFVRGHPAGYGWEGLTTCWLGCVTASETPFLPAERLELLKPNCPASLNGHSKWSLRHSRPYRSREVACEIARWMEKQASTSAEGPESAYVPVASPHSADEVVTLTNDRSD